MGYKIKGAKLLAASIFACLLCSMRACALNVEPLERISDDSEFVEILEPEEGYDFDVNFIAKNQELSYKTTLTNDEELPINIDSISITAPEYDFLEYSYYGIAEGDRIEVGDSADFTITIKTNANDTTTIAEDYNLTVTYTQIKPTPENEDGKDNPETKVNTVVKTSVVTIISLGAIIFVFVRNKRIRSYVVLFVATSLGICAIATNAIAEDAADTFVIHGKVRFTNIYSVIVNPNDGTYDGDLTATRREGEKFHIGEATRQHFEFVEWEINPTNTPDENNDIEIHADTTIKAKWNENSYTLTINPNGGEYKGSTEVWSESYRPLEDATIETPELEGYNFVGWTVTQGADSIGVDFDGSSIAMTEDVTLVANYEIKTFTVTVITNGGTYHESENTFTTTVDWNTDYEIETISRDGYDLKEWTKTVGEDETTLTANTQSINIKADTTLEAIWWSSTFYTVTIVPDGGTYDGDLETSVREGTNYTMQDVEKDGSLFSYWTYTGTETRMNEDEFTVTEDVSLTANWVPIIAQIIRDGEFYAFYPSIMAAHDDAVAGDTVELLVDTEEIVTNTKDITLDLGTHTVTGYLVNAASGNLLLINGEFDNYTNPIKDTVNPDGAAAINNGTLTLGFDDYADGDNYNKAPNIDNDYIRLIGSDRGLIQNGHFYFYDGHIDGVVGLIGGYDGAPWYRDTDSPEHTDTDTVYYYPFVSRIVRDSNEYQRVQLANSNRAVSRTIDNGAIYYYDLQDNINASAVTGYNIYAVRNFDNSAPITIASGDEIVFDTDGYKVDFGDTITINGDLTIKDGKSGEEGEEKGSMTLSKSLTNNGQLTFEDIEVEGITANTMITRSNSMELKNAKLKSSTASVYIVNNANESIVMDNDSLIESMNSNFPAVILNSSFEIGSGNIKAVNCAVRIGQDQTLTLSGGVLESEWNNSGNTNRTVCGDYYSTYLVMTGGEIKANGTGGVSSGVDAVNTRMSGGKITASNDQSYGIFSQNSHYFEMTGGEIEVDSTDYGYGVRTYRVNITNGSISSTGPNQAYGIYTWENSSRINGKDVTINVSTTSGRSCGLTSDGNFTLMAGTVKSESIDGEAIGYCSGQHFIINGDDAVVYAKSKNNNAYGVRRREEYNWYYGWSKSGSMAMSAGVITGETENDSKIGSGVDTINMAISGGTVTGTTYGIGGFREVSDFVLTLGNSAAPIYNGQVDPDTETLNAANPVITGGVYGIYTVPNIGTTQISFYDGIITGGTNYISNESWITAVPDGAHKHVNTREDGEDCWLEFDTPYLHVEGYEDRDFRSLGDAFNVVEDGGQITVIDDRETNAVLPTNSKNITLDLNGHELVYSQTLANTASLKIVDSRTGGSITNRNTTLIDSTGTLEIAGGTLNGGAECTIWNRYGRSFTLSGGTINGGYKGVCTEGESTTRITSGKITATHENARGVDTNSSASYLEMSGGEIEVTGSSEIYGIISGTVNITGGSITATGDNVAYGVYTYMNTAKINGNGVSIDTITTSGKSCAVTTSGSTTTFTAGTVSAVSTDGEAFGFCGSGAMNMNGDNAKLNARSVNNNAYGARKHEEYNWYYGWQKGGAFTISAGEVSAVTESPDTKIASGVDSISMNILGGKITGTTYGVGGHREVSDFILTIGVNEAPLYNGLENPDDHQVYPANPIIIGGVYGIYTVPNIGTTTISFYDGKITGGTKYVNNEEWIQATPDGAHKVVNTRTDGEDSWLEYDPTYLHVEGYDERDFRSLSDAYAQVEDGGQITVVADVTTKAVLPNNSKNITIDLNGHILNYSQPLPNAGTLKIVDSRTGGTINNSNSTIIENNGTVEIASGTLNGGECTVWNRYGHSLKLSGGVVTGTSATICTEGYTTTQITGGRIVASSSNAKGINTNSTNSYLEMTGGEIEVTGSEDINGVVIGRIAMTGGNITVNGDNIAHGMYTYENPTTINNSNTTISVTTTSGKACAMTTSGSTITLTAGTVTANSTDGEAYGYCDHGHLEMNGDDAKVTARSTNNNAFGAKKVEYYTSGYWGGWTIGGTFGMSAGEIKGIADDPTKLGVGVDSTSMTITGGSIYGTTYGVGGERLTHNLELTIGKNEEPLYNGQDYPANPIIEGGVYGIYTTPYVNTTNIRVYDGKIIGGTRAIHDMSQVKYIATGTNFYTETVDGKEVRYLVPAKYIAKINDADCTAENPKCYTSIIDAANASSEGDIITLLDDDYVFYQLETPAGKKFTLDLDGHKIITGIQIKNNSDMTIVNSGDPVTLEYGENNYFITNNQNAKLTIDGVNIKAKYGINAASGSTTIVKNASIGNGWGIVGISSIGNLTLDNVTIEAKECAVSQSDGATDIENSSLSAVVDYYYYTLDINNSTGIIENTTLHGYNAYRQQNGNTNIQMENVTATGLVINESGTLSIDDSAITKGTEMRTTNALINNKGTMTIKNKTTVNDDALQQLYEGEVNVVVTNSGTLTIDDSVVKREDKAENNSRGISSTGAVTLKDATIKLSGANNSIALYNESGSARITGSTKLQVSNSTNAYGIYVYNAGAHTTMLSGETELDATNAYGAWVVNGTLTLGEAEPLDSVNRGTGSAAVSTTSPLIEAVGSSKGYAITLENGSFNYYDGKLVQNEEGFPAYKANHTEKATITNTEYWYEPQAFEDGNGHYYYILTYMPQ